MAFHLFSVCCCVSLVVICDFNLAFPFFSLYIFFVAFQDLPGGGIKNDTSVEVEDFSQDLTVKLSVFHKTFDEEEVCFLCLPFQDISIYMSNKRPTGVCGFDSQVGARIPVDTFVADIPDTAEPKAYQPVQHSSKYDTAVYTAI